jgi:hypothetical protein
VTAKLPERIKRALDAYNDVVIAWHLNVSVDEVDNRYEQLVAAIAEHVAPVDAPTEAEIEAWRSKMERGFFRYGLTIQNYTAEAVALMRRAAAAKPVVEPWPNEHGTHDVKLHYDGSRSVDGIWFSLTDKTTGVVTRYVPEQAAATPAPSALERLRERVDAAASYEAIEMGEWRAFDWVLDWIDEEREREAKR